MVEGNAASGSPVSAGGRFTRQVLSVLGTKGFVLLAGVVASVILARGLGTKGLGVYTAIFAVIHIILSLADMGIRQAITYTMGQNVHPDEDVVSSLLVILVVSCVASIGVTAAVFATGPARGYGFQVIAPAVASIPFLLLTAYTRGVTLAKGWVHRFNVADLIQQSAFVATLVVLVLVVRVGVIGATISYLVGAVAAGTYSFVLLNRVTKIRFRVLRPVVLVLVRLGLVYAANLFVLTVNYRIGVVLLERMVSVEEVGIYGISVRLAEMLWQLPGAVGIVLFSRSARSSNASQAVSRTAFALRALLPIMVSAGVALYFFAPMVLTALFGEEFRMAASSTRILIPGVVVAIIFKVIYQDLAGRGHPRSGSGIIVMIAVANIVLDILLIPRFGVDGAAIAATVSYVMGALAFLNMYAKRERIELGDLLLLNRKDLHEIRARAKRTMRRVTGGRRHAIVD